MKKKILMSAVFLASAAALGGPREKAVEFKVDPASSKVEWVGKKVTGQHNGSIALKGGKVSFAGAKLAGGSLAIDMTSIKDEDLTNAEYNKKLIDHLSSDDFFSTARYNEATLVIKSAKELRPGEIEVLGDLTIKGVTQPVTFPARVSLNGDSASASGKILIDRTKYGIRYGSGKFFQNLGDKMIHDEFELTFSVNAKK